MKHLTWQQRNAAYVNAKHRKAYAANREDMCAAYRARYAANVDAERARNRNHYARNRKKRAVAARKRRRSARHKRWIAANRLRLNALCRKSYYATHEKRLQGARKYRLSNQKKIRAALKRWAKENPEAIAAGSNRRRARERGNGGSYTALEWKQLKSFYRNMCLGCGKSEQQLKRIDRKLVPDHVLPIAKGGRNDILNIQPLCHGRNGCNNHKSAKHIDYRPTVPRQRRA